MSARSARATAPERERLHHTFEALCRIDSPTGRERPCADWIRRELGGIGVELAEDGAGPVAGSDSGNLWGRIDGRDQASVMLCAHMDTVPAIAPIEPRLHDGVWENANAAILGADNKAAVAVLIELARRLSAPGAAPEVGLELVFTVCEENGLHGAKAFDCSVLRSPFGYVYDHASPIGEIVTSSPTYQRVTADLQGRAAHAGIRPEAGRSAIAAAARAIAALQLGRLDSGTTCNVGTIAGGTTTNVVPEHCRVEAEVRGLQDERVETVLTEVIDRFQDAADGAECDLDITVERMFSGYRTPTRAPEVALAERALAACGHTPTAIATGGGSDANAFQAQGFACVNLANGTEANHEPVERVSAAALEDMLDVSITLLYEHGRVTESSEP